MVRVCPSCSHVDVEKLQDMLQELDLQVECIGECGQHEDQSFGYINDELVIKDSEEEFLDVVRRNL